jgi:ParB-like chromosome segregation protein Spo0J
VDIYNFTPHPLADKFPMLDPEGTEYKELVQSIKDIGQQHPILVDNFRGQIIDGRNRLRACKDAGVEPKIEVLPMSSPEWQIVDMIMARNVMRRHLGPTQRAAYFTEPEVEAAIAARVAHEANVARAEATRTQTRDEEGKFGSGSGLNSGQTGTPHKTAKTLAKQAGVGHDTITKTRAIRKAAASGDEVASAGLEKMKTGEASTNKIYNEVKKAKAVQETQKAKDSLSVEELDRLDEQAWVDELYGRFANVVRELLGPDISVPTELEYLDVAEVKAKFQSLIDDADAVLAALQNDLDNLGLEA